jgi:hypothetical protein
MFRIHPTASSDDKANAGVVWTVASAICLHPGEWIGVKDKGDRVTAVSLTASEMID